MIKRNTVILIPTLDPSPTLLSYVQSLKKKGFHEIIVVDDGSDQKYRKIFRDLQNEGCKVLVHAINLGKGRAIKTGFNFFLNNWSEGLPGGEQNGTIKGIITVDSDGQHSVEDVVRLDDYFVEQDLKPELVLGARDFNYGNVPFKSRFGNELTSFCFRLLYGKKIKDTQTGLRGIPTELVKDFLDINGERFEYETNQLIRTIRKGIPLKEIDINTIYIDNNSETHFDPIGDSWTIYKLLFGSFIKYTISSLSASIIDLGIFQLLITLLKGKVSKYIWISTVGARIASSLYNYLVNKCIVFESNSSHKTTFLRYYILCIMQMMCSALGVSGLARVLPMKEVFIKIIVDTLLFCISYRIQRKYIFILRDEK